MSGTGRRTVEAYDDHAVAYAGITRDGHPETRRALRLFLSEVGPGARVLEVASGPGWDADALEAAGISVRRTDLSDGFIKFQRGRGKTVTKLDLVDDDLGGPWDGLVALYVLQHLERDAMDGVVGRMAAALHPGAVLLTSFQEGEGQREETGAEGGTYRVVKWSLRAMLDLMTVHGLDVVWRRSFQGSEARWTILIARRS